MLWIPSDSDISIHPKTRKAARLLGLNIAETLGYLHMLWHWCVKFARDGDITQADIEDIAATITWPGEPQVFIDKLVEAGFIDIDLKRSGKIASMRIHNWHLYAGKFDDHRKKNADKQAHFRRRRKENNAVPDADLNEKSNQSVTVTPELRSGYVTPYSTVQENTVQKSTKEEKREERNAAPTAQDAHAGGFSEKSSARPDIEGPLAMAVRQVCRKGLVLSARDREKLESTLAGLEREGANVAQVEEFGRKCAGHWISYDSRTKQARAPAITQVLEHWREVLALPEPVEVMSWKELDELAARYEKKNGGRQ